MPALSVNIDHVATIRQARYRQSKDYGEPDVVLAVREVELGGAEGVTMHLREDRRHVIDRDVERARELAKVHFNFEIAATDEMVAIASRIKPQSAMLVPEGRHEVTTEGGLDVAGQVARLRDVVARLREAGCLVSAFLNAEERQIDAAKACGFDVCEVHTGPYAEAFLAATGNMQDARLTRELAKVREAGAAIQARGMRFNAGHALGYANVGAIAALPGVRELHIGHAIVSRAVFVGLREATAQMKRCIDDAPLRGS
jgi:pyridoxine 5-phosphate synthase